MGREDGDTDGALDSVRGIGVPRDSDGREGVATVVAGVVVSVVGVGVEGVVEILGATVEGTLLLGRVVGVRVCVIRSDGIPAGTGAGRLGELEGARPAAGMLAGVIFSFFLSPSKTASFFSEM